MKNINNPLIFLVEDNKMYREMVRFELEQNGYLNFQTFDCGSDCINNLYQMPDIVLLDYYLDDINGIEIMRSIKSMNPDIQVIFLSGQKQMTVAVNALKYGAFDYLVKNEETLKKLPIVIQRIIDLNQSLIESNNRKGLFKIFSFFMLQVMIASTFLYSAIQS